MRRPIAAITAAAALIPASPAAALTPQPFTDVTPAGSKVILCPAELGGGAGVAWLRFGETAGGRDVLDLSSATVDPPAAGSQLQTFGGCPRTATAPSGATLVALNRTGFSAESGRVFAFDRAPGGATGPAIALNDSDRAQKVSPALASSGAALVAWTETTETTPEIDSEVTTVHAATRTAGGAFQRLGRIATPASRRVATSPPASTTPATASSSGTSRSSPRTTTSPASWCPPAPPGGAFSAPRELGSQRGRIAMSLVVGGTGEALLAVSGEDGMRVATGTTRTGLGAPRKLATVNSSNVAAVLTASGAAAVAWTQGRDEEGTRDGVRVSDRPAGGDFGVPRALSAPRSRLAGSQSASLRLAAAPDGRVLASWVALVPAGDGDTSPVPVASMRRADGSRELPVPLAGPCRVPSEAFPGFDAAGQPRVVFVDSGIRGKSGPSSGLFDEWARLRAGRQARVTLAHESYFDDTDALDAEGRTVKVRLVVHACDSAGRIARARRTISVRVPRTRH